MKHTEKYLQAKWVTENPKGYDERDVARANSYCEAYLEGYTHCIKINLDREAYNALSETERKNIPILGGMHELERQVRTMPVTQTIDVSQAADNPNDDLPF